MRRYLDGFGRKFPVKSFPKFPENGNRMEISGLAAQFDDSEFLVVDVFNRTLVLVSTIDIMNINIHVYGFDSS